MAESLYRKSYRGKAKESVILFSFDVVLEIRFEAENNESFSEMGDGGMKCCATAATQRPIQSLMQFLQFTTVRQRRPFSSRAEDRPSLKYVYIFSLFFPAFLFSSQGTEGSVHGDGPLPNFIFVKEKRQLFP